jgi:hypothetical protein
MRTQRYSQALPFTLLALGIASAGHEIFAQSPNAPDLRPAAISGW